MISNSELWEKKAQKKDEDDEEDIFYKQNGKQT